ALLGLVANATDEEAVAIAPSTKGDGDWIAGELAYQRAPFGNDPRRLRWGEGPSAYVFDRRGCGLRTRLQCAATRLEDQVGRLERVGADQIILAEGGRAPVQNAVEAARVMFRWETIELSI